MCFQPASIPAIARMSAMIAAMVFSFPIAAIVFPKGFLA
jgi:hypothetical protein